MVKLRKRAFEKIARILQNPKSISAELMFLSEGLAKVPKNPNIIISKVGLNWNLHPEYPIAVLWGFSKWKSSFIASYFPEHRTLFIAGMPSLQTIQGEFDSIVEGQDIYFFRWGKERLPTSVTNYAKRKRLSFTTVEDGFLRSFEPGALHVKPYSLIFDNSGIYFDVNKKSDIETLLNIGPLGEKDPLRLRAEAGITMMRAGHLSKYYPLTLTDDNLIKEYLVKDKKHLVVIGQIEKDASIKYGRTKGIKNILSFKSSNSKTVLMAAKRFPNHKILYRPHPDEIRSKRKPNLNEAAKNVCKILPLEIPLEATLEIADATVVRTSLVGLEAKINGITSTVLNSPFYAGWGVTDDFEICNRRNEKIDLVTLFARSYIDYPQYIHPGSDKPCDFFELASYFIVERVKFNNLLDIPKRLIDIDALQPVKPYVSAPLELLLYLQETPFVGSYDATKIIEIVKPKFKLEDFEQFSQLLIQSSNYDALLSYCEYCAHYFSQKWDVIKYSPVLLDKFFTAYIRAQKNANGRVLPPLSKVGLELVEMNEIAPEQYMNLLPKYAAVMSQVLEYEETEQFLLSLKDSPEIPVSVFGKISAILCAKPTRSERNSEKRHRLLNVAADEYLHRLNIKYPSYADVFLNAAIHGVAIDDNETVKRSFSYLTEQFGDETFSFVNRNFRYWGALRKRLPHFYRLYNYLLKKGDYDFASNMLDKHFFPPNKKLPVDYSDMRRRLLISAEAAKGNHLEVIKLFHGASNLLKKEEKLLVSYARSLRATGQFDKSAVILKLVKSLLKTSDKKMAIQAENEKLQFVIEASRILNSYPQPTMPKGVIVLASQTCYNTLAMMVPSLVSLKKKGYAVVNLMEGMTRHEPTGLSYIDDLAGCLSTTLYSHELSHSWEVNWDKRIVSAAGINFYQGFYERLSTSCRSFFVNLNQPNLWKDLQVQIKRSDKCLQICERIYNELVERGLNVAIVSGNSHVSPFSIFRDYCRYKAHPNLTFINCNVAYESYYSNLGSKFSGTMCVTDMTLHSNRRAPAMALEHKFKQWYKLNKNNSEFKERADKMIKINRNSSKDNKTEQQLLSLLTKKKAQGTKIIACFGKVPVDLGVPYDGGPAHQDMSDWITHTVDVCGKCEDILLLVKPHPHELRPEIALDLITGFESLIKTEKKSNVMILGHKDINTYALAPLLDMAILYNGSSSLELTALGVPVMMCAYFGQHDYPVKLIYPESRPQYEKFIKAGKYPKPNTETRKQAAFLISYMGTEDVSIINRYAKRQVTNDKVGVPSWRQDLISDFLENGDSNMDLIAGRVVEKFEGPDKNEVY